MRVRRRDDVRKILDGYEGWWKFPSIDSPIIALDDSSLSRNFIHTSSKS